MERKFRIPLLRQADGRRTLAAVIDGREVNLLIDTGSDTYLSERIVRNEKLVDKPVRVGRAALGPCASKVVSLDFSVPGLIGASRLSAFVGRYENSLTEGEFNVAFLRRFGHVLVDFLNNTLTLYPRNRDILDILKEERFASIGYLTLCGLRSRSRIIARNGILGARNNLLILVDTGASRSVFSPHLRDVPVRRRGFLQDSEGNRRPAEMSLGQSLCIHPFEFCFSEITYCVTSTSIDVRLGMDVLDCCKIFIPCDPSQTAFLTLDFA